MNDGEPRYHHGDLRAALLAAAGELLDEHGLEAFTLRACARRAGVSHAAPAHHFRDRRGLLTALAATARDEMTALMRRYRAEAGEEPFARLVGVGVAYVDFAVRRRARFLLMERRDIVDTADRDLCQAMAECYGELLGAMQDMLAARGLPVTEKLPEKLLLAWATVHGFASLVIEGRLLADLPAASREAEAHAQAHRMLSLLEGAFTA